MKTLDQLLDQRQEAIINEDWNTMGNEADEGQFEIDES